MFMANAHPTIHSVPITVYSFTLLGSGVKSCDPHLFGGPFFSYVRQDDDYFSLARRLGRVTGDADWDRYRLAVVELHTQPSVSVPHFITRPVPAQTPSQSKVSYESKDEEMGPMPAEGGLSINTALGAGAGVGAGAGTPRGPTVWQLLRQKGFGGSKSRDGSPGYARIAIQRSVSDIAGSKRSKRLATNSIKII
ncbi:hypothetical protein B484DRAFT_446904 [Ochromonadaceae sp. CCMP2298]|nr:hypothetical protein B484DRAFT_446904 [Ochromonadaceae sp. CCMP2298]